MCRVLGFLLPNLIDFQSAFSSFPDSTQFDQGSQTHSFRIRETDHTKDDTLRDDRARPLSNDGFIYGYSHFTQKKDRSSKRGYKQVSHFFGDLDNSLTKHVVEIPRTFIPVPIPYFVH
jgi:hypothetical protein